MAKKKAKATKKKRKVMGQLKTKVPVGIRIISILIYLTCALLLIGGIALIAGANAIVTQLSQLTEIEGLELGTSIFTAIGIVIILIALLLFFVAKGLWKAKQWARITTIILSAIMLLDALMNLTGVLDAKLIVKTLIKAIIYLVIGVYLFFNKNVKAAFS